MRIQKRLVISNMAMILIPLILIMLTGSAFSFLFDLRNSGPDRLWPDASDMQKISRIIGEDPYFYLDPQRIRSVEERIGWRGLMIVQRGKTILYASNDEAGPSPQPLSRTSSIRAHSSPFPVFSLVLPPIAGSRVFDEGLETTLSLYLDKRDVARSYFIPAFLYMLMVATILILTNGSLARIMSRTITRPLATLQSMALRIRDGDLNPGSPASVKRLARGDEFDGAFAAFDEMRERLKASLQNQLEEEANRRELIAAISHDLRTPLAVIKGYAEGLRDGVASDPAKSDAYLQTILAKAAQLDSLIEDLFLFSRLELEGFSWDMKPLALGSFLRDCMEELAGDHPSLQLRTTIDVDPIIRGDAPRLHRVFSNIVQNAARYGVKPGEVCLLDVTMTAGSGKCMFVFHDHGPGLEPGSEDKIFTRFYRSDPGRGGGGAGLGLAIARRIVEAHGGTIRAETPSGGGAAFIIELPVAAESA